LYNPQEKIIMVWSR